MAYKQDWRGRVIFPTAYDAHLYYKKAFEKGTRHGEEVGYTKRRQEELAESLAKSIKPPIKRKGLTG